MNRLFNKVKSTSALPKKFDAMIEAVRCDADGQVEMARIYERRGPTWSDRLLVSRDELVTRLKAGKKMVIGARKPYLASTFEVFAPFLLVESDGQTLLSSKSEAGGRDNLEEAPRF